MASFGYLPDASARRQAATQRLGEKRRADEAAEFGWDDFLTKILLPVGVGVAGGITGGMGLAAAPAAVAAGAAGGLGAGLTGAATGMGVGTALGQGIEQLQEGRPEGALRVARALPGVRQAVAPARARDPNAPIDYAALADELWGRRRG